MQDTDVSLSSLPLRPEIMSSLLADKEESGAPVENCEMSTTDEKSSFCLKVRDIE